jgi:ATP-dependent DNA helicase RecQ
MKLANLARDLGVGRVLALTATATPSVAKDIASAFGIAADDVVQTGFYRPNLELRITPVGGSDGVMEWSSGGVGEDPGRGRTPPLHHSTIQPLSGNARDAILLARLRDPARPRGPTIVYVTLQKTAEDVARALADAGLPARAYHAGMDNEVRHEVQDWFMASGDAIVVATIAFGMGIDKSDIRYVYHYNLPKSLENYAQEIGRAGRDGKPSVCELLACPDDATVLENFTFGDTPTPQAVAGLLDHVLDHGQERFDISTYELSGQFDVRPLVIETLLTYLELDGVIESTGPFYNEYKFQPLRPSAEMLARFDPERQQFLRRVLAQAKKLEKWFRIDVVRAAEATGQPRERVVAALNYLEEQGDLTLQVAGARHGYRRLSRDAAPVSLSKTMTTRFLDRERRDVDRLNQVLALASHAGCVTRFLLAYFGETRDADCGHCGWCRGDHPTTPFPDRTKRPLGDRDAALVRTLRAAHGDALATPRQMAKFLCGIGSPGLTRAKLSRHEHFGAWTGVPFRDALRFAEQT